MTASHIVSELVGQVSPCLTIPKMVVRIDDQKLGLEDRLLAQRKPFFADRQVRGMDYLHGGFSSGSRR
ncbi:MULTISPECIES: hypothetical protein [unclassified Caballeronia]|uniref:hypothetical protein n=1 Tax=unclassified Caballeronia TaxID=2646786 RepID=UPI002028DA12|nr:MULTISPECIES: hypothetical protein [unclassified Caballeronia]